MNARQAEAVEQLVSYVGVMTSQPTEHFRLVVEELVEAFTDHEDEDEPLTPEDVVNSEEFVRAVEDAIDEKLDKLEDYMTEHDVERALERGLQGYAESSDVDDVEETVKGAMAEATKAQERADEACGGLSMLPLTLWERLRWLATGKAR